MYNASMKIIAIISGLAVAAGVSTGVLVSTHPTKPTNVSKPQVVPTTAQTQKPAVQAPSAPPSFYLNDSQTINGLTITPTKAYRATQADFAMQVPENISIFLVKTTVRNNTADPVTEAGSNGISANSSIYLDSGKYVQAVSDGGFGTNTCGPILGADITTIAPYQTVTGCVPFLINHSDVVDTYFYSTLKWYL